MTRFTHLEYREVVKAVYANPAYEGKTVVVCWEHHVIPDLAKAFGVKDAPRWHEKVFDEFWIIQYPNGKAQMTVVPERVLAGDRGAMAF